MYKCERISGLQTLANEKYNVQPALKSCYYCMFCFCYSYAVLETFPPTIPVICLEKPPFKAFFKPHFIHRYKNSARAGLRRTSASGLESLWQVLIGLVMSELSRARKSSSFAWLRGSAGLQCSSQPWAFSVLTSMFSCALKSAVTFTVTSQHALCLP